jgi:hypothetical protein
LAANRTPNRMEIRMANRTCRQTLNRFIIELYNIKFDDERVNDDVKRLKNRPLYMDVKLYYVWGVVSHLVINSIVCILLRVDYTCIFDVKI